MIEQSKPLRGEVQVIGAKNAVLVIMASLILTSGKSRLINVPGSDDMHHMCILLRELGANVTFYSDLRELDIDTTMLSGYTVGPEIMKKMRASILVMGPLLARFGHAHVALPGGCVLGDRPVDYHLKGLAALGATSERRGEYIESRVTSFKAARIVLEYPSVGATENILMAAVLTPGTTRIINAALEPEVLDLIEILQKMGASIAIHAPATIEICGVSTLKPVEHTIIPDRLEAGTLLVAAAITRGALCLPEARPGHMDVFLDKLSEMGHVITVGEHGRGVEIKATQTPRAVSFKTMPFPGFPTDLQAPMFAAQCVAEGTSVINETVYENRLTHARELRKMGAQIVLHGTTATIKGVDALYGTHVIAPDIRGAAALVCAGLVARGYTAMTGIHHLKRGYEELDKKLSHLGAHILWKDGEDYIKLPERSVSSRVIAD